MSKSFLWTLCAMFLFLGIIIGFLWAPVKNGVYCGNNNGNNNMENCTLKGEAPPPRSRNCKDKCKNKV